jgi:hypothetical protein
MAEVYSGDIQFRQFVVDNRDKMIELLKLWDFGDNNKVKYIHFKDALSTSQIDLNPNYRNRLVTMAGKYLVPDKTGIQDQAYLDYVNFYSQFI